MNPKAKDIFLDALDLEGDAERRAFIERACAGDPALLQAVLALLDSHAAAVTLRPPVPSVGSSIFGVDADSRGGIRTGQAEQPGDVISGRYELIKTLGEGGFGVVYLARQREPVVRDVALKLLKGGADSGQIVTRFEAERQTLARMDHPGIARVFDAGTSERGRPYFVMEYVDGPPITTYCNSSSLGLYERLRLLEQVCGAVQHAHTKGIIHRDLKPGNILITQVDGRATPKVIDFGIAKAIVTDGELGVDQPTMTLEAQIIGTPQYMAPEQATIGPKNIDTRSDVYSLGTVMYELIVGTPPFDPAEMRRVGLEQVCKMVRERVPPRPSTRISALGDSSDKPATWNGFDLARISKQVSGEIDWIVMKALEKEPARRYQSAADLAADIRRYLRHEPVSAGPPSRLYAMRKFVRRHRIEVAAAVAVITALVGTAVVASFKEHEARQAEIRATVARGEAVTSAERAQAAERQARESEAKAIAKADEARRELAKANAIADFTRTLLGGIGPSVAAGRNTDLLKDLLAQATDHLDDHLAESPTIDLTVRSMIGRAEFDLGDYDTALATLRPAYERLRDSTAKNDPERLAAGTQLGRMLVDSGKADEALTVLDETVAGYASHDDRTSAEAMAARIQRASALLHLRRLTEAMADYAAIQQELQQSGRGDGELSMVVQAAIATIHRSRGDIDSAVSTWEHLLFVERTTLGPSHPRTLDIMGNLAFAYHDMGRLNDAEQMDREILKIERTLYEPDHPNLVKTLNNLGAELLALKRLSDAEPILLEAERIAQSKLEPTHRFALAVEVQLMNLRSLQHRYDDAVAIAYRLRDAYATRYGLTDTRTFAMQSVVLGCLADAHRYEEGLRLIERLGPDPVPADLAPDQKVSFNAAAAQVLLGLGRVDDAQHYATIARRLVVMPDDGSPPRIGQRLRDIEQALAERATTRPTSRPVADIQ